MILRCLLLVRPPFRQRFHPPVRHSLLSFIPNFPYSPTKQIQTFIEFSDQDLLNAIVGFSEEGIPIPTSISLSKFLSRCCETKSLGAGFKLHAQITKSGLLGDSKLRNHLINLYSKCGVFKYAHNVLDESLKPDLVAWSALISGYSKNGLFKEALVAFQKMHVLDIMCNEYTFPSVLKACAAREDLISGRQIHRIVVVTGFESDVFVANTLVVMYAKCGECADAKSLFDEIPERNVVSWNALFSSHLQGTFHQEAVGLFNEMVLSGLKPNEFSLSSMLNACTSIGDISLGKKLHGHLVKLGYEADQFSSNALVDMYAKVGELGDALAVFENLLHPDNVSWNAIIAGCVLHEDHDLALDLFQQMKNSGLSPTLFALSSALKACAGLVLKEQGRQLHSLLMKIGAKADLFVGVGLIDVYSKCSSMNDAQMVFKSMPDKDVVAWNAMLSGHVQNDQNREALVLFAEMFKEAVGFNQTTLSSIFKCIASLQAVDICRQVHALSVKLGLHSDDYVLNSLVDSYGKCGNLGDAGQVFEECKSSDMMSFTSMITTYSQSGQGEESLKLYLKMQGEGLMPDPFVCSSLLNACANLSAYEQGKQLHAHVLKLGYVSDIFAGNSLVNMYAKCGSIDDATHAFSKINERGIVSWSAMIGGLAQHGHGKEALLLFDQMLQEGVSPNQVTLVSVLCACNHAGLVDEAKSYFESMKGRFGIKPTQEHYACMIDILGRAGKIDEAMELLNAMPFEANAAVWGALLGAAKIHKNVELGQHAADKLFILEPDKSGTHVILANIYASAGMWQEVSDMRRLMKGNKVKKEPGLSWIEMKDKVYSFLVGDKSHPRSKEIYAKLDELRERISKAGYVPALEIDLHDVEQREKELLLFHHSEKLAVAFGLIATAPGAPIRVKKNLRICIDCHTAFKFISQTECRDIIVRDTNRYHHFKDGSCSCGDYW